MSLEDKDTFHVVIRLPFKRPQGFVEPPAIVWTEEMEHKLWQYMSQKNTDWNVIAEQLGVPTSYVVRHAAFIYETQLRGIHQQLRLNTNNSSINRNNTMSPTPTKPRSTSIRYSNTLQYQQQIQQQQQQESQRIESSGSMQRSNTSSRLADKSKDNVSIKSSLSSSSAFKSTSTATYPVAPYTINDNSLGSSSSSEDSIHHMQVDNNHADDDGGDDEREKTDDEEFSSHFERMKLQVEEPAFLPRQSRKSPANASSSGLHHSRQALSMSIQNLKKLHIDKLQNDELPMDSSSAASSQHSTKTSSTQPQSPSHSPATNNFQISTAPGSSNESAMNSIGSSFSDISDSSVTQSALEEAFLSKFNQESKMSMLSFSRKQ
ncbi:hypothetical protein FB192DRAFT_1394345 [Mucor lusitanicus]|uniref:Autophagy-related protein 29 n=1 Tax=Mucor circinelloides f. lusitanicus TaxID=29924 RepID=A0A8H4BB50_MUCCL|nr:hypothetical protein FB192DRAFT_1394345 [Mucor lusitanicus]